MNRSLKSIIAIIITLLFSGAIILAGSQHSVAIDTTPLYLYCALVGFILHWIMFLPAFAFQTERYFDLTGSLSFIATVGLAVVLHPGLTMRGLLIAILVAIWALRLGTFLFMRISKAGKDQRFDDIKGHFFRFLFTWTLGGAWVFLTLAAGLVALTSTESHGFDFSLLLGGLLWIIGFGIEVIADRQKSLFRNEPDNDGKFITSGLWAYSRHPNYFGEILLWLGIAIIALPALQGWQWVTLVSPVFVIVLLTRVSGIPMLEKSAEQRWGSDPDYVRYRDTTPVLIPRLSSPA